MLMDLSPKQIKSIVNSTARLNIWEGSVRSGKSLASLIRFIKYIQEAPLGNLIICGRTATTVKRNIVDPLMELLGNDPKYYIGKGEMVLWGRTIHCVGASDERAEQKIRGSSYSGAYVDEITLLPESFWTMLLSRLSIPGAKLFGTTNPDSPLHWLKTNYIDRDDLDLKTFHFQLDDNPSLTDAFKNSLKQEYRGLWYQRFIDGKWVLAEGTVFDFFDFNLHCIDYPTHSQGKYYVGVDFGTANPTAFVMIGYNPQSYPNLWVEKEYYWDPKIKMRQKTTDEFAADLAKFVDSYPIYGIYIDPSAATFKLELSRSGVSGVLDADNDVLEGIRFLSMILTSGTIKVSRSCVNLIAEFQSYTWDKNAQLKGVDKPKKDKDHAIDSLRYSLTSLRKTLTGTPSMDLDKYRDMKASVYGNQSLDEIERQFRW